MSEKITNEAKRLELIGGTTVGFFFPQPDVFDISFYMDCCWKKSTSRGTIKHYETFSATFTCSVLRWVDFQR